jgi:ribosomal protein S18 acetylase RimI-like enzyme
MTESLFRESTKLIKGSYAESNFKCMTNFIRIRSCNASLLLDFLQNAGSSLSSFRYYSTRDVVVVDKHIATYLLFVDGESVAYGHLDSDGDRVWLGICVKETSIGRGYGYMMMDKLISSYSGDIFLSVDITNHKAIRIYEQFGFKIISTTEKSHYMSKSYDTNLQTIHS